MSTDGSISSRITRLNQLLSGKTYGKKVPLIDKETLLDAFFSLYHECNTDFMTKDKNIATYIRKFKPLICEIEKLRLKKSDFEIRKTIGRGHFGEVHVVREKVTGNVYAMKVLKKSETLSQDNVAFFEEERDIMAFAGNPWITTLQYAFQDFESLYLVMDFHPGGDLLSLLSKNDDIFEENVARFYLGEMIMAMHAVHALGYVHRDIKPENVLIDRLGHIKLADFGSSAKLSSAKMVVSKMPVGTPEYIAPEVLMSMDGSGGGGKYGIECDWWSLGVVAYEMMMGCTPFQADSVVVVYSQIMNFKNSLQFPADQPLTDNAKDLIRSLLTDQKNRISYADLAQHPFFSGLDWTTLQDAVPPYVPNVMREDDTSNFDDFETESSGPNIEDFMERKKGFQGTNLPFIGFTFTKQLTLASQNENCELGDGQKRLSSKRDSTKDNATSTQLIGLKVDLEKEQKRNKELKSLLDDKARQLLKVENEREVLENEKVVFDTERKDWLRKLDVEKNNRLKAEDKSSQLLKEHTKSDEAREEHLKFSNEHQQQKILHLETERAAAFEKIAQLESELTNNRKAVEDSKSRVMDLQSKLGKINEDTKSNVSELQHKLQKVTVDSESRIRVFQEKLLKASQEAEEQLFKSEQEKRELEVELLDLKNTKDQFQEKEANIETVKLGLIASIKAMETKLATKNEENLSLQQNVQSLQHELEESKNKYNKLVEFGEDLKEQVERKIEKLKKELVVSRKDQKRVEENFKKLKEETEDKNNNLHSKDSIIASLQASCSSLEKQIISTAETSLEEEQRRELTQAINKLSSEKLDVEGELNNVKAENKANHEVISSLRRELEENAKQYDENVENYESTINKLSRDLTKTIDESNKYQKEVVLLKSNCDSLTLKVSHLETEVQGQKEATEEKNTALFKDSDAKLVRATVTIDNLKSDKKELDLKLSKCTNEITKLEKEIEGFQEELCEKERQANSQDLTIQMLKQTCTMLEGQVEELEVMNDEYQDREATWNLMKRQHYQVQEKLEHQLSEALNSIEQERKLKVKSEEKLQTLSEDLTVKPNLMKQIEELEKVNNTQESCIQEISNSLSEVEKKNGLNTVTIKQLERKLKAETEEKLKIMQEISNLEDLSAQQTSSNFALTVEIESLKESNEEVMVEKVNLQNQLERTLFEHAESKIKMESTLAQQTKLIDFLQKKVMDDKNFSVAKKSKFKVGKQKSPTEQSQLDVRKTRDLERALEKEKNANLQLHLQIQKVSAETSTIRTELQQLRMRSSPSTPVIEKNDQLKMSSASLLSKISNSPSTSIADIYQQAVNEARGNGALPQETSNNSPHTLSYALNMRPSKCPVCLYTLHFAKQISKCSKCNIMCHSNCATSLENQCGVTVSPLLSLKTSLSRSSMVLDDGTVAVDVTDSIIDLPKLEGWLKFPRRSVKQGWERKWIRLSDMKISIFDNETSIAPVEEIELNITDGELNIHPAIPASELIWSGDPLHVFSVEILPYTLGMMRRNLYFLAPNFSEKQKWITYLEHIASEVKRKISKNGHGLADEVMLTLHGSKRIDVNCAVMLTETGCILGCEDGLYVVEVHADNSMSKPAHVVGLGPVYQLQLINALEMAVLVAGKDRLFCTIDTKDLNNRLKQLKSGSLISAISSHQIEKVKNCHLFITATLDNEVYACAATGRKLNIFKFNKTIQNFSLKKEIETSDPCSCLLLSSTSVIYGTVKFHSIELKNFQKRDFLDASDTSLAFAVYGTSQTQSSPVALFKVSSNRLREEYLLCFSEFGVFVDWQGRRSRRGDLKWSRLPLAFSYQHPFLYITQFGSIEICEIFADVKADISTTPRRFIDVPEPRFIGGGFSLGTVLLSSSQPHKLEIISYRAVSTITVGLRRASPMSGSFQQLDKPSLDMLRSESSVSICSDEETSLAISNTTPKFRRRQDQIRTQEKEKNRISFRFFNKSRKSQYDEH